MDEQRLEEIAVTFNGKIVGAAVRPDGSYRIEVQVIAPAGSYIQMGTKATISFANDLKDRSGLTGKDA
jgi:hypothetical protein